MLVLRDAQLAVLAAPLLGELRAWLHPHLRKHFGGRLKSTDDASLDALIDAGVTRALEHGARRSPSICKFVYMRVLFDERFEALPWAAATLARTDIRDPDTKIETLYILARRELASRGGVR